MDGSIGETCRYDFGELENFQLLIDSDWLYKN